jgi:hypothetical protein
MMMKIVIEAGEVEHNKLTNQLTFKIACNMDAILATEDTMMYSDQVSMEEIANEMAKKLERMIYTDYHRGGRRIKYD